MANPKRQITFFKRDIDMTNDSRMRKVLRRYGGLAVAVYEEVLAMVYETGSYFLPWSDDYALDIADRLYEPDQEKIRQIIGLLIESGLFSKELFDEFGILTSRGIQERFTDRGDQSHRRREIHQYALAEDGTAQVCAEVQVNARICAEVRATARECANMRSRDRERDRAIDYPPPTPPLGASGGRGGSAAVPDEKPSTGHSVQPSPPLPASNALTVRNTPNIPSSAADDFSGVFEDSMQDPESAPVSRVIRLWNDVFRGTVEEYTHLYPTAMIAHGIEKRLKITPDLETFRKVFVYARQECEGRGLDNHRFIWTLGGLFRREEAFDHLLAKATAPPPASKLPQTRGAPVLTASDYDSDPW